MSLQRRAIRMAAMALAVTGTAMAQHRVLVEAESFGERGGWKLDQQFVEQMGSPYLLAHGMGVPVANARTTVTFPATGTYTLHVRTRNWVPGPWEAPGRFRVLVNGTAVDTVFGTEDGWAWQAGGTVTVPGTRVDIELQDLTGFDGRCDALYFTAGDDLPPGDADSLAAWRAELSGMPERPPVRGTFDVVIVGGGISGCAAALAADKAGIRAAIIHDRPVFGGNASNEIRVHTEGIAGPGKEIMDRLDTVHWPNGSPLAGRDDEKRTRAMAAAANLTPFLNWRAYGVETEGNRIVAVRARHTETGEVMAVRAPLFIDTTGDGWIGYWAGAEYRYGREAATDHAEAWGKWGDLWAPTEPDGRVMGSSLLWYSKETPDRAEFPPVPWAADVAGNHAALKGEWYWEFSSHDRHAIDDGEAIRDHMLRAIYGSFANAKKRPENANRALDWVGYLSGKRESRRLMGDYVYTMADAVEQRYFPDTVVVETRDIDVHYQRHLSEKAPEDEPDFLSHAIFRKVDRYYIPFRCLYSRNIENLMMAGRCFSCSHIGLGGPRVMMTCGQMGIATGYAAALCRKYDATPREVGRDHIAELRSMVGEIPEAPRVTTVEGPLRTTGGKFALGEIPTPLQQLPRITLERGDGSVPAPAYEFRVDKPVTVYLGVHERGTCTLPGGWQKTDMVIPWGGQYRDRVYRMDVPAGTVQIPGHDGREGDYYGLPHQVFLKPAIGSIATLKITGLPAELDAEVANRP